MFLFIFLIPFFVPFICLYYGLYPTLMFILAWRYFAKFLKANKEFNTRWDNTLIAEGKDPYSSGEEWNRKWNVIFWSFVGASYIMVLGLIFYFMANWTWLPFWKPFWVK